MRFKALLSGKVNLKKKFLNYPLLLNEYEKFSTQYSKIQRLFPKAPLYLEVDAFLNIHPCLYHDAPYRPSLKYRKRKPRNLNTQQQITELKKYCKMFKKTYEEGEETYIDVKIESTKILQRLLTKRTINNHSKKDIKKILDRINALNSYPINKTRILNNNSIIKLRKSFYYLIYGKTYYLQE